MKKEVRILALLLLLTARGVIAEESIRIGWISPLTGPAAKYRVHESALIAVDEFNARGGINGQKVELIMEDAKCDGPAAALAAQKLISIDKVEIILGGHCSTETLAVAPIAQRSGVLLLASTSSSPAISNSGSFVFRSSPNSRSASKLLSKHLLNERKFKTLALLYDARAYPLAGAEELKKFFTKQGGKVIKDVSFMPGEQDFRSILSSITRLNPDALYIATQDQDSAFNLVRQIRELKITIPIYGNENVGNSVLTFPEEKSIFNGITFVEAAFNRNSKKVKKFAEKYTKRFGGHDLPYGFWTAESYDAVNLLLNTMKKCGTKATNVQRCFVEDKSIEGIAGTFHFDANGDAVRNYSLKQVINGHVQAGKPRNANAVS